MLARLLLLTGVLMAAVLGEEAPAASPCAKELARGCEAERGDKDKCEACTKKVGSSGDAKCTLQEELAFCAPPVDPKCEADLNKYCADRRGDTEQCDACVERVERAKKDGCTRADELRFCDGKGPKPPVPTDPKCARLLDKDCAQFLNMKNESECAQCTFKAAASQPDIQCTERDEFNFCSYGPKGEPACVEALQRLCGKPWGGQHANRTACTDCVVEHEKSGIWRKENCTRAEVQKFC